MPINEIVERITLQRKEWVPQIREKQALLDEMVQALDRFDGLKAEMPDGQGNVVDGRFKSIVEKYPDIAIRINMLSSSECRRRILLAKQAAEAAMKRFSRDTINIAVIGKARVGKSEFLKSISNLSDYVIPAFSETDCTGAVSVIENKPGMLLEAKLTFKTEREMVSIVQTYLDRIIPDMEKRIVIRNMYQIRDLDMDEVNSRKIHGRADNNLVPYLAKFVEHYEEWAPLVKQGSLTLHEEEEIQTYVAQNNGKKAGEGQKAFYRYLAVSSCEISCTFDYQEAGRITLVDTVGFEDNAIGIEDELIRVVNDKSDAVVFILFPLDGTGGGVPAKISDIYRKIEQNCKDKNLDKWLFWLINHAPDHPKTPNPREFCEEALKTLDVNAWSGEVRRIVDVHDQNQVREEFLIPLLNTLMENLDDIDVLYLNDLKKALDDVKKEYGLFCAGAKKVFESEVRNAIHTQPQMARNIDQMIRNISARLTLLCRMEARKRDIPCEVLKEQVAGLLENMRECRGIPDVDQVREELLSDQPAAVYIAHCNRIRNQITQSFAGTDSSMKTLVAELKNSIADILLGQEGACLERVLRPDPDRERYEWLGDFTENILQDKKTYPNLYMAFRQLYQFEFSVRGFLTYEVRACLDPIDPDLTNVPDIVGEDEIKTADNICFYLERKMIDVVDSLNSALNELFKKPSRAFFAVTKEFCDRVIYSENVRFEWNQLLAENYPIIWAEEYRQMAAVSGAFGEWDEVLNGLLKYNERSGSLKLGKRRND